MGSLNEDLGPLFVVAVLLAAAFLVWLLWRSRESLSDLDRKGDPRVEPRDRSARSGPRTRIREWVDPRADGRPDRD